jgi:hypothetical protein
MRKWIVRAAILLGLLLVGLPAALYVRITFFPPRFDVPSIAALPEHKDAALLERAWALPVASTYRHRVDFQSNGSTCGPTSLANVFRSLSEAPATAAGVLEGSGKCPFGVCMGGLSLDELAALLRTKTGHKVTLLRDLPLGEFREHMKRANDPARRYVANFHRGLLFSQGVGHHSPVAGYLEDRDLVFVLDVNGKFGPWLVPTERLFRAVDAVDSSSGKKRGLILVE